MTKLPSIHDYPKCRPAQDATDVERFTGDEWVADDGRPGIAFSGLDMFKIPVAWWYELGRSELSRLVERIAMDHTCNRFLAANGRNADRADEEETSELASPPLVFDKPLKLAIYGSHAVDGDEWVLTMPENFGKHPDDAAMTFMAEGCFDSWEEAKAWKESLDLPRLLDMRLDEPEDSRPMDVPQEPSTRHAMTKHELEQLRDRGGRQWRRANDFASLIAEVDRLRELHAEGQPEQGIEELKALCLAPHTDTLFRCASEGGKVYVIDAVSQLRPLFEAQPQQDGEVATLREDLAGEEARHTLAMEQRDAHEERINRIAAELLVTAEWSSIVDVGQEAEHAAADVIRAARHARDALVALLRVRDSGAFVDEDAKIALASLNRVLGESDARDADVQT